MTGDRGRIERSAPPDGPRTALAEALARVESQAPDDANETEREEWRYKADAILTALPERGYTIVASDRLQEVRFIPQTCPACGAFIRVAQPLSRSEATVKGAPRE